MTHQSPTPMIDNLVPADGKLTEAARKLGPRAHGDFIYIRVLGSDLTTLEPQFYGSDLKKSCLYGKQNVHGHDVYYLTEAIERREVEIRRVVGGKPAGELHVKRNRIFPRRLAKAYRKTPPDPPADWRSVPDKYPRHKFLMKVAQERKEDLRTIGFTDEQIDIAARTGKLSALHPRDENGNPRKNPDGSLLTIPFHVHHCIPLQCAGSNTMENFALVDDMVHLRLFHRGDDPAVSALPEGKHARVAITMPRPGQDIISIFLNVAEVVRKKAP
ncbi:MAG: hypothetical protein Q4P24_10560 [Rhodobacterales bacterium]|nr:hypothetical protein [Rhodobacterales bacterium]